MKVTTKELLNEAIAWIVLNSDYKNGGSVRGMLRNRAIKNKKQ